MKSLPILIITSLLAIITSCNQTTQSAPSADVYETDTIPYFNELDSIAKYECMTFNGVPFNLPIKEYIKGLESKGFALLNPDKLPNESYHLKGSYLGQEINLFDTDFIKFRIHSGSEYQAFVDSLFSSYGAIPNDLSYGQGTRYESEVTYNKKKIGYIVLCLEGNTVTLKLNPVLD